MKRKQISRKSFWISILVIAVVGIGLLARLVYIEGQEKAGVSATAPVNKEDTENESIAGEIEVSTEKTQEEPAGIEAAEEEGAELLFTGDVFLSSYVLANYDNQGIGGVLSEELADEMNASDILMINQEFPFGTTGTKADDKQYTFRVNPSYVSVLKDMGTDICGLANNHVLDYGKEALVETFSTLDNAGILYAGAGDSLERAEALQTMEAGGEIYGFLAASRVIPVESWNAENSTPGVFTTYSSSAIVSAIKKARQECDYLTIFVHWGIERNTNPEDYQISLAHEYIDAGADLVIGSHPHVLQGIEYYNKKPIFYSLGNFIFNQSIDKTMLVKIRQHSGQSEVSILPACATGAKTQSLEESKEEEFYQYLEGISEGVQIENGVVSEIIE